MRYKIIDEELVESVIKFLDDIQFGTAEHGMQRSQVEIINMCSYFISELLNADEVEHTDVESEAQSGQSLSSFDPSVEVSVDLSDEQFCNHVLDLKQHILAGDIFQVVPSRTFSLPCPSPLLAYAKLKESNPSPYMFYMQDAAFSIFGASPESALKYERESNQVEIYPIAGTRPRGKRPDGSIDRDLDSRIELNLREDTKEKSEHIMLVDLARNDVAKVIAQVRAM